MLKSPLVKRRGVCQASLSASAAHFSGLPVLFLTTQSRWFPHPVQCQLGASMTSVSSVSLSTPISIGCGAYTFGASPQPPGRPSPGDAQLVPPLRNWGS